MKSDRHEVFRRMIDETLAGRTPIQEESLREHLQSCAPCQEYLTLIRRVIASLSGFSFEVDLTLQARVCESIRLRARQLEATPLKGRQLALICTFALVLTAAGSFIDLRFGDLIASLLDIENLQMRQGLVTFWILPSMCLALVFPLLPLLSKGRERVL